MKRGERGELRSSSSVLCVEVVVMMEYVHVTTKWTGPLISFFHSSAVAGN